MTHIMDDRPQLAPVQADLPSVRILLVDDTPQNLLALEVMLDGIDLELVRASSGEEALRCVLREDYAVILLDVLMPGIDGLETAALIRARERSRDTPIIFVTAAGRDEDLVTRGYALGAVDYIVKPIQPVILRSKVAVFVELYRKSAQVKKQAAELAQLNADLEARVLARTMQLQTAQAAAVQERDRLQQVIEALPAAVVITDRVGQVVLSNTAAEEVLGRGLMGRHLLRSDGAALGASLTRHLDGTPFAVQDLPLPRVLVQGRSVQGMQMLVTSARDGCDLPILLNCAPLRDADGITAGAVVVFQDISALKSLERQKDEFLAIASHDLKNPLTNISGMAQLLQRRLSRPEKLDLARLQEGLASIYESALRTAQLLTELMDITRLQMERPLDLNLESTDLVLLVQRVVAAQQQATDQHVIRLQTTVTTLEAMCDPVRMERVLGNLLSNAQKYSPDGGEITVVLSSEDAAGGSWAVLQVRDQGLGIPVEDLPHVFERFFRGHNVTSTMQGSGLGLASVRQIVEQHGGVVTAARNPDVGTTFTVRLPRRQ